MTAEHIAKAMVRDYGGDYRRALIALAQSYLNVCSGVSAGYLRVGTHDPMVDIKPDPPAVCDDSWISTGRE